MKNGSKVADICRRPNGYFLTAVATALALLTGVSTNSPPRIERVELSEGTNLHIDASGRPGKIFRLERSTTLTNWSDVDSVDATTTNFSFLRSIVAGPGEFFRVSMHPGTNAPAWGDQEDMRISVLTTNAVRLRWGGATGLLDVTAYRVYRDGILIAELPTGARSYDAGALGQGTAYTFRVEAVNEDGVVSLRSLSGSINPSPPDPASIAPGPGSSEVSTPQNGFGFLYAGQNPIQAGVSTQDIDSVRCAIVHGKVMDRYFNPLQGTVISVDDHPEFGRTVTRADGKFDMAVNGGGALTLLFAREDRLPARRTVNPAWGDDVVLQSVVLIEPDPIPTELVFPSNGMQMAEGSLMEDQDGSRRMRLLVPADTTAQMVMPNGTRQPLEFGHLRLSEYTVGTNGPQAMPAPLPGSSEYTYAVNLSFDEEREAGAQRVEFSPDVVGYVENLAGFPVGIPVPIGTLLDDGVWVPQKDGRVVGVVGETAGLAELDIDGDGAADDEGELAAIGISESERRKVAELYTAGTELWRMPYPFISNKDSNWAPGTNGKKTPSKVKNSQKTNRPSCLGGYGVLEMQNQILQEDVAVVGAPFTLHYASDRMPGYLADHILDIDIIGASVPPELVKVDMTIKVVGRSFESTLAPQANLTNVFLWDGLDAYGREVQGRVPVVCQLDYVYPGYYCHPSPNAQNGFATMSGMFITNPATGQPIRMREDIRLTTVHESELGRWNALGHALGGWSLSIHHVYDPVKRVVYLGDGGRQDINGPSGQIVMSSGGTGTNGFGGDGGDAALAEMNTPRGAVVGPDGSIYVADTQNNRIRKISGPSNIIETVVGTGTAGFSGDDGPGTSAQVNGPRSLAMDPQGNLYFCDTGNNRVRCLGVDGVVTTVAGTGAAGFGGDGGSSTAAQLNGPQGLAVATDGALFVADTENNRVRRIGLDGIIDTAAGTGTAGFSGDDGSGLVAQLNKPSGVALAEDGSLFIADTGNNRVRELRRDGRISTYAGTGAAGSQGDGGDPSQAQLNAPAAVGVGRDSTVYIADASNSRVRRVGSNRIITTAGGTGTPGYDGEGAPGPQAQFDGPQGVAVGPDRRAYVADSNNGAVRGMGRPMTPGGPQEVKIGSEDGTQVYVFDASGRHLRTMDAFSAGVVYEFIYDPAGRLIRVRDAYGKVTEITRDGSGKPTTIVSPYGQSTALELNPNGILATVTSPAGDITRMSYVSTGLLSSVTGPRNYAYTFTYDDRGQLASASDPGGGLNLVPRTTGTNGHEVTETTVEGRVSHFSLTESDEGTETTEDQYADGTIRRRIAQPNGTITNRLPDGTIIHSTQAPEPRFQMQSPFFREMVVSTPGGVTLATTVERGVNLLFRKDPLSLTRWSQATTQNGKTSRVIFESSSRVFTRLSPMGRLRTTKVNTAGDPEEAHRGDLAPTTYEYNAGGQLTSAAQGSRLTKMGYNAQGYLSTVTNAINQVWRYAYDAAGRTTNTIRPDGQSTATSYDGEGNLISLTPPGKPAHGFSYTPVGLLSGYVPPPVGGATNAVRWTWNRDRKIDSCTRADGGVIDYVYNSASQVESLLCPGFTNQYVYDPAYGYLASVARGGQTVSFVKDGPLPVSETWSGPVAGSVSRGWNADFRVASITVGGTIINSAYDDDGLPTQAGDMYLDYDTNGLHVGTTLGNLSETWRYNPFGEVTNYTATCSGSLVLSLTYTRDPLGRITALTSQTAGSTQSVVYAYDAAGRLNHVTRGAPPSYDYLYDANGNRTNLFAPARPPTPATYDAQDRILTCGTNSYTWSDDGELTSKIAGSQTTQYRYDGLGHLTGVTLPSGTIIEYVIDGLGRRVGKKIDGVLSRGFLYSGLIAPVAELDGSNNIISVFVYAGSANVPDYMVRGGTVYRLVSDHLGSVRLVVNAQTGTVAQEIVYDEFGGILSDSNPGFQPFGFAGGLYDPDTGLVHFGAREYDPETGRWTRRDPLSFAGDGANLYAYCGNDPVNLVDSFGLGAGQPIGAGIITGPGSGYGGQPRYPGNQRHGNPQTPQTQPEPEPGAKPIDWPEDPKERIDLSEEAKKELERQREATKRLVGAGAVVAVGTVIIVVDIITVPSGEGLIGAGMIQQAWPNLMNSLNIIGPRLVMQR